MDLTTPTPAFLDEREIAYNSAQAGLGAIATQTLRDLARRINADPQLRRVTSAAHQRVYDTNADFSDAMRQADAALGADADLLHALFVLDSIRLVRQRHAARGVPPDIAQAVNRRHAIAWLKDAEQRGHIGIADWMPGWLRTVASGHLYRLGRLEFLPEPWDYPARAYTHVRTQELVLLAESGQRYTDDGYLSGDLTWTSTLIETDDAIIGTPITPCGVALPQPVRLPRAEWQLALGPGDPVLDLHIPAEGALTLDAIRDALMQAEPFFDRYYPNHQFAAYVCSSWLFSPQLETMLASDSNILRWQHEGYLLPSDGGDDDFLTFTFGARSIDTATAPRDTRLRRAVIAHLERGALLRCGAYLLLRRDLGRFGSQPYRHAGSASA
jgi:GNAT-like C-terminal domain/N-acyltransferase N-terminal domain